MIWNDIKLREWASAGGIEPYNPGLVNPASVDLRWSGKYRVAYGAPIGPGITDVYTPGEWGDEMEMDRIQLLPNRLYLLDTVEYIRMPTNAAGFIALKSSVGRMGIEHLHAGFFDPGFHGTATWEVHCLWPGGRRITKGQRLMQLVLEDCYPPARTYQETGRYNGQTGPTPAKD